MAKLEYCSDIDSRITELKEQDYDVYTGEGADPLEREMFIFRDYLVDKGIGITEVSAQDINGLRDKVQCKEEVTLFINRDTYAKYKDKFNDVVFYDLLDDGEVFMFDHSTGFDKYVHAYDKSVKKEDIVRYSINSPAAAFCYGMPIPELDEFWCLVKITD